MRLSVVAFVLLTVAGQGCLGSLGGDQNPEQLGAAAEERGIPEDPAWNLSITGSLGWVAAAGLHAFPGDFWVGVMSHERCPGLSFVTPENASNVTVKVETQVVDLQGAGLGSYNLVVKEPQATYYYSARSADRLPEGQIVHEVQEPDPGPWALEVHPYVFDVNQAWSVSVEVGGLGEESPNSLYPTLDGDCGL